jgi:hypothetical protein
MIDKEDIEKLFIDFEQLKNSDTEKYKRVMLMTELTNKVFTEDILKKLSLISYYKKELCIEILNAFYTSSLITFTKDIDESLNNINKLKKYIEMADKQINTS